MAASGRRFKPVLSIVAVVVATGVAAGVAAIEPTKKQSPSGHAAPQMVQPGATPNRVSKPPTSKPLPVAESKPATEKPAASDPHSKPAPKVEAAEHEGDQPAHAPTPAAPPAKREVIDSEAEMPSTPDAALALLREGNVRWVKGKSIHPNVDLDRRAETGEKGQKPFATILACADSRLPVERLFDRGLGDLFVVRVAGNIAGTSEGGSIEYGVEHLHTPVLVVMGHTRCGAVAAAVSGSDIAGPVGALVDQIKPAVERARAGNPSAKDQDLAFAAVRENVWQTVFSLLRGSKTLRDKCKAGDLRIVGAIYNVSEGTVDFMGPHPWQSELIVAFEARANKQGTAQAEASSKSDH